MNSRIYWQAINETTLINWERQISANGSVNHSPVQLLMRGSLLCEQVQGFGLSRLTSSRPGFPEWDQTQPPSWRDVEIRWRECAKEREQYTASVTVDSFPHRRAPAESTIDFYTRVAHFYKDALTVTGRPTKALAKAASVPHTTAARWVREARQRGLLTATTKGRCRV